MKSILQEDWDICHLCGRPAGWNSNGMFDSLEEHHIFEGNPRRELSDDYGLTVRLHGIECHREGKNSAHKNIKVRRKLEAEAQQQFEKVHGSREDFMRIFGKNYL